MDVKTRSHLSGEPSSESEDTQAVRIARAESLLRTVIGIADVRVVPHPSGGIAVVRVDCGDEATPGQVMRNIRSALFAGLGISISPECVDFVLPNELNGAPATVQKAVPSAGQINESGTVVARNGALDAVRASVPPIASRPAASAAPQSAAQPHIMPSPLATPDPSFIRQRPAASAAHEAPAAVHHAAAPRLTLTPETASDAHLRLAVMATAAAPDTEAEPRVAGAVGRVVRDIVASAAALKLESVELRRQSGRLRCRVVVSLGADHFGAVADSSDPHAGEIHLTGRVTCDALRAGGFTEARFDGATIAQINGREHVVVALSEWANGETMVLSGAAPLEDTHERAAAIAAIKAVLAQDIS